MTDALRPVEPVMGRPIADMIQGIRDLEAGIDNSTHVADGIVAYAWAIERIRILVGEGYETEIVEECLASIATCFASVERFDQVVLQFHAWLKDMDGCDGMLMLSGLVEASSQLRTYEHDDAECTIIPVAIAELIGKVDDAVTARTLFRIEDFEPAFKCDIGIYEDAFVADVIPQGEGRFTYGTFGLKDEPQPDPLAVSGRRIPGRIRGWLEILSNEITGKDVRLVVNVSTGRDRPVYGPLEVVDPKTVRFMLEYGGPGARCEWAVAQPTDAGRLPVIVAHCKD